MPKYDFECSEGHTFEEIVPAGMKAVPCPDHPHLIATMVYLPGSWTTHGTGIFPEQKVVSRELGVRVSSRRKADDIAKRMGLVRRDQVVKRTRRDYPDENTFERGLQELKDHEVRKHQEARERSEFEVRSGLQPPPPEE